MTDLPNYEAIALKYAWRTGRGPDHFIGGDPHDVEMPMDYYLWVIRGAGRLFLVDTGFNMDLAVKRKRTLLRTPAEGLKLLGIDASEIRQIVITHFHNDHVGTFDDFPGAEFHVQDEEMTFATGRFMRYERFNRAYEPDHVAGLVRLVYANRVVFHRSDDELAPGITVHHIGGHSAGLQVVRVHTARGWVVIASDASHYYEHFERQRAFPLVYHVGELIDGYRRLESLAESPRHIIPGHDPLVIQRYPPVSDALRGMAVHLDADPIT